MSKIDKDQKLLQSFYEHVNKNYLVFLNLNDRLITRNLREARIETREASSNGLWCCILLPAVLMIYNFMYKDVSQAYSIVAYTSLGLVFYCILFIAFLTVSCLVLQEQVYGGCIASSLVSALLLYTFVLKDLTISLAITLPAIFLFSTLLRVSLTKFPKTFTIGEAMVVSQSIVLYIVMTMVQVYDEADDGDYELITNIVNTVLSSVAMIVTALTVTSPEKRNLLFLKNVILGAGIFALVMLHSLQGKLCVMETFKFVFRTKKRMYLFLFWVAVLMVAVAVVLLRTRLAVKANTVTRKSFHILASIVFLSGIIYDQELMLLASGVGLGLLVLVEALRKSDIDPISSWLQSAFLVYCDEKDCGSFAMTPIYLFCGLAGPLLLAPRGRLAPLSGVLAVGVGDSAASWLGARCGRTKWPGSSKSIEGTAFNVFSQVSTIYALQVFGLLNVKNALLRTAIAASVSGLAEALTVQVDNLILPLITLLAFQLTWPIS